MLNKKYVDRDLGNQLHVWSSPSAPDETCFDLEAIAASSPSYYRKHAKVLAVEWFLDERPSTEPEPESFAALWCELVGSPLIAFDMKERMARLGRRDLLDPYLEAWHRELSL